MARRYDDAISWATTALQLHPKFGVTLRVVIAALAFAGRLDEARETVATLLKVEPGTSISSMRETYMRRVTPQNFEILADGLRKAGFPE